MLLPVQVTAIQQIASYKVICRFLNRNRKMNHMVKEKIIICISSTTKSTKNKNSKNLMMICLNLEQHKDQKSAIIIFMNFQNRRVRYNHKPKKNKMEDVSKSNPKFLTCLSIYNITNSTLRKYGKTICQKSTYGNNKTSRPRINK